ncbi:MAG: hypothetical protein LBQ77_07355 [Treponema sp.]|nr:hypothetical protein [Treponema sp.]
MGVDLKRDRLLGDRPHWGTDLIGGQTPERQTYGDRPLNKNFESKLAIHPVNLIWQEKLEEILMVLIMSPQK